MPTPFIKGISLFKIKLTKRMVTRIIEMQEIEKVSFVKISKELHITPKKAKRI